MSIIVFIRGNDDGSTLCIITDWLCNPIDRKKRFEGFKVAESKIILLKSRIVSKNNLDGSTLVIQRE
jgi:hypothetical protein